jgi:hypothetical protein
VDSGIAVVADERTDFVIKITPGDSRTAEFYINGALVATISTINSIPFQITELLAAGCSSRKTLGTNSVLGICTDYMGYRIRPGTVRPLAILSDE